MGLFIRVALTGFHIARHYPASQCSKPVRSTAIGLGPRYPYSQYPQAGSDQICLHSETVSQELSDFLLSDWTCTGPSTVPNQFFQVLRHPQPILSLPQMAALPHGPSLSSPNQGTLSFRGRRGRFSRLGLRGLGSGSCRAR